MTRRLHFASALAAALFLSAAPALAAPATAAGAERIEQGFKTYFGPAADVAKVTPQGASYALDLDFAALFDLGSAVQIGGSATPLSLSLTDNGDGTWDVAMDQPFSLGFSIADEMQLTESFDRLTLSGTFDEASLAFTTMLSEGTGGSFAQTERDPVSGAVQAGQAQFGKIVTTGTSTPNPTGGLDMQAEVLIDGWTQTMTTQLDAETEGMSFTVTSGPLRESGRLTGFRNAELMAILAWVVAHPDETAMMADRADLKALIVAALPVFDRLTADLTLQDLAASSPFGDVGLKQIDATVEVNGLGPEGKAREALTLSGLTLPPEILPAWAVPVLPETASFDVQVTGYDAAAAAALALTALDLPLGQDPADDFGDQVLAALLPHGMVTIGLNPGAVAGAGYRLGYEGSLDAGPETEIPAGQARVTLTGIEVLLAALNDAPDDMKMQAMMGLGAMRGLAKPGEAGELVWVIDGLTPGVVTVNGMDLSSLGGGP